MIGGLSAAIAAFCDLDRIDVRDEPLLGLGRFDVGGKEQLHGAGLRWRRGRAACKAGLFCAMLSSSRPRIDDWQAIGVITDIAEESWGQVRTPAGHRRCAGACSERSRRKEPRAEPGPRTGWTLYFIGERIRSTRSPT